MVWQGIGGGRSCALPLVGFVSEDRLPNGIHDLGPAVQQNTAVEYSEQGTVVENRNGGAQSHAGEIEVYVLGHAAESVRELGRLPSRKGAPEAGPERGDVERHGYFLYGTAVYLSSRIQIQSDTAVGLVEHRPVEEAPPDKQRH